MGTNASLMRSFSSMRCYFRALLPRLMADASNRPFSRAAIGTAAFISAQFLPKGSQKRRALLLGAHRTMLWVQATDRPTRVQSAVETDIQKNPEHFWEKPREEALQDTRLLAKRLLVLRAPDATQKSKGVLLLKFTGQFGEFTQAVNLRTLCDDYTLVLEPSYSGYADDVILQFQRVAPDPVIVMSSESRDFSFLQRLGSNLVPVTLGSSDWVDPSTFTPLANVTKRYDCIMVAGWERLKRHHALFRAVAELRDSTFQVCLIGSSWINSRKEIEELVAYYGLGTQVTLFEGLTATEVNLRLNESRFNVLMTRREGSNKSLFEGMFADIPALALDGVIGPNREWLRGEAGRLVAEKSLSAALLEMRSTAGNYQSRAWAMQHISPNVSIQTLGEAIEKATGGATAASSLTAKVNAPELRHFGVVGEKELPTAAMILERYARRRQ